MRDELIDQPATSRILESTSGDPPRTMSPNAVCSSPSRRKETWLSLRPGEITTDQLDAGSVYVEQQRRRLLDHGHHVEAWGNHGIVFIDQQ